MALPTIAVFNTAINAIYDVAANRKTLPGTRYVVGLLQKARAYLITAYAPDVDFVVTDVQDEELNTFIGSAAALVFDADFAVTDVADADLAAFFITTGELATALPGSAAAVGDIFKVQGSGDTTDNALQGAKGSAPANDDYFIVTNIVTEAVVYLGNAAVAFADGELRATFGKDIVVGDIFQVGGDGDTVQNDLQTAKGSAPADGDVFEVATLAVAAPTITWLGDRASVDFSDNEIADFVNL